MIDWNIQSRAHACQACEQPFVAEQNYHTLLFDEKKGYLRLDVCEACWTAQYSQGASDRKGFISHWQGLYHPPPAAPPEPIAKATAEILLRQLLAANNPQYVATCYILAVMLERKRMLKVQSLQHRDGQRVFVYEQPNTGDLFTIVDPDLHLNQLDVVQHDVARLIEHGLNTPASQPAEAPGMPPSDVAVAPVAAANTVAMAPVTAAPAAGPVETIAVP